MEIRAATMADAGGVLAIVNREIREGSSHFATTEQGPEDVRAAVGVGDRLPFLVAVGAGGEVLGFAKAARWKARESYDWSVEIGVYVDEGSRGRGVGRALYAELFPRLERLGYRTVLAGVALPNEASVRLHQAFGMELAGTLPRIGFKHGRWIDVSYWVRHLGAGPTSAIAPSVD